MKTVTTHRILGITPEDFFDFIIIDECHRGGANDESSWRDVLEHFAPAVQLGLTATPQRKDNANHLQSTLVTRSIATS